MTSSRAGAAGVPGRRRLVRAAARVVAVAALLLSAAGLAAGAGASSRPVWREQAAPSLAGDLAGISCPTATACVAVGSQATPARTEALAESWSGGRWRVERVGQPGSGVSAALDAVSCASATACVAVGFTGVVGGQTEPVSEVLAGGVWRLVPAPSEPGAIGAVLDAVSCATPSLCRAVGSFTTASGGGGALAESYDGSSWTRARLPAVGGQRSGLAGVSCLAATLPALCTAVGSRTAGGATAPLVEHDDGSTWTVVPAAPVAATDAALDAVSCPQPTSCVAVGTVGAGSGERSLAQVETLLRWRTVLTLTPARPGVFSLLGVACALSVGSCQAVGAVGTAAPVPLAEGFDGRAWSVERSAAPGAISLLAAVSCVTVGVARAACSATGSVEPTPDVESRTLVEAT